MEYFVEAYRSKLCVILRLLALHVVCPHYGYRFFYSSRFDVIASYFVVVHDESQDRIFQLLGTTM